VKSDPSLPRGHCKDCEAEVCTHERSEEFLIVADPDDPTDGYCTECGEHGFPLMKTEEVQMVDTIVEYIAGLLPSIDRGKVRTDLVRIFQESPDEGDLR
jgi:hypothetical protein